MTKPTLQERMKEIAKEIYPQPMQDYIVFLRNAYEAMRRVAIDLSTISVHEPTDADVDGYAESELAKIESEQSNRSGEGR